MLQLEARFHALVTAFQSGHSYSSACRIASSKIRHTLTTSPRESLKPSRSRARRQAILRT